MKKVYQLAVEATLDVIGGKWKPIILCHLGAGPLRNGQLLRLIPAVSQRVLTQQLRELERDEIIQRRIYQEIPPRVEYCLTDHGKSLRPILLAMSDWGEHRVQQAQVQGAKVEILDHNQSGFDQMKS